MRTMSLVAAAVLAAVRSALFVALVLASKVVVPVLRLAALAGTLMCGFFVLARRDQVAPMRAGGVLAVAAIALKVALAAAVRALASPDVVVICEV